MTTNLVNAANWAVAHRSQFNYAEIRPVALPAWGTGNPLPNGKTWTGDCSAFMTLLCKWSGLFDPNGPSYNFDGYGNGASEYDYLPHISRSAAIPGDCLYYYDVHVVMFMQNGSEADPLVVSMGEQGDPRIYNLSEVTASVGSNIQQDCWKMAPRGVPGLYAVTALPPGHWKGKTVLTGTVHGNKWYTVTVDGHSWTTPSKTEPNPSGTSEFYITKNPPGWWGGTVVLGGNGTDNNRWHTSTANGTIWGPPRRT